MNIPLLRQIQDQIRREPKRFDVRIWFSVTECGTTACIAGFAIALHDEQGEVIQAARRFDPTFNQDEDSCDSIGAGFSGEVGMVAASILRLDSFQSARLFYAEHWPIEFTFLEGCNTVTTPELAIARIDRFIETNGEE